MKYRSLAAMVLVLPLLAYGMVGTSSGGGGMGKPPVVSPGHRIVCEIPNDGTTQSVQLSAPNGVDLKFPQQSGYGLNGVDRIPIFINETNVPTVFEIESTYLETRVVTYTSRSKFNVNDMVITYSIDSDGTETLTGKLVTDAGEIPWHCTFDN